MTRAERIVNQPSRDPTALASLGGEFAILQTVAIVHPRVLRIGESLAAEPAGECGSGRPAQGPRVTGPGMRCVFTGMALRAAFRAYVIGPRDHRQFSPRRAGCAR